eukprot:TRINITY_DN13317_c0_g1_i1.p1 TRINITY_DN13317_c0_g1~~TRINITY_DN13317_c0_g1_i1.p1  ORF type:complete len:807 (-),score=128.16 TRINITY_DN13317_c0_g1_i1:278-2431(-)
MAAMRPRIGASGSRGGDAAPVRRPPPPPPPLKRREAPPADELYGKDIDATFAHPFVRKLLRDARGRVAFGEPWVICIRTYGRSGLADAAAPVRNLKGLKELTLAALEDAGLSERPELRRRVHIFVAHDDPHFTSGRYEKALGPAWASRIVVGVRGADRQVRFIEECFCPGQHVIVCDDNLLWLRRFAGNYDIRELWKDELEELFQRASNEMVKKGAHLWGISPTHNARFMKCASECRTCLGLVYGAFFGFLCLHEPSLYTQFGQVKDDLERTLRYWQRDRVLVRFGHFACRKNHKPGSFGAKKGGISQSLGVTAHRREGETAVHEMAHGFARAFVRLPVASADQLRDPSSSALLFRRDGQPQWKATVSDTGVVFNGYLTERSRAGTVRPDSSLVAGYCCKTCRLKFARCFMPPVSPQVRVEPPPGVLVNRGAGRGRGPGRPRIHPEGASATRGRGRGRGPGRPRKHPVKEVPAIKRGRGWPSNPSKVSMQANADLSAPCTCVDPVKIESERLFMYECRVSLKLPEKTDVAALDIRDREARAVPRILWRCLSEAERVPYEAAAAVRFQTAQWKKKKASSTDGFAQTSGQKKPARLTDGNGQSRAHKKQAPSTDGTGQSRAQKKQAPSTDGVAQSSGQKRQAPPADGITQGRAQKRQASSSASPAQKKQSPPTDGPAQSPGQKRQAPSADGLAQSAAHTKQASSTGREQGPAQKKQRPA